MIVFHGDDPKKIAGTATYHATKKLGFATASKITLQLPSGTVSLDKEGGLFSTNKRTFRSAVLGEVYWNGRYAQVGTMKLVDGNGKILAEYKAMRVDGRMGTIAVNTELGQEGLDEVVVSGIAMLSEEMSSMSATAAAVAVGGGC